MTKYYYAGEWLGQEIYLEKGMKLDWTTKVPLFFMKILPYWIKQKKEPA